MDVLALRLSSSPITQSFISPPDEPVEQRPFTAADLTPDRIGSNDRRSSPVAPKASVAFLLGMHLVADAALPI